MFPFYTGALRVGVAQSCAEVAGTLSGREAGTETAFDVETVSLESWVNGAGTGTRTTAPGDADCLVVPAGGNGEGPDIGDVARRAPPALPVVGLVEVSSGDAVERALEAGVAETMPRQLVEERPDLAAERVQSVVERERARAGYREVYDRVDGTVSVHDADTGELIHANESLCDLLGYDRGTLLSMTVGEFTADVPGYDHERAMRAVRSVGGTGDSLEVEWPLETVDGAVRWLESTLEPVSLGGREYVLSVSTDVTERRRREHEYERIFDGVTDAISVHDPWNESVVDVNEAMCALTGYGEDALLAMNVDGISAGGGADDETTESERFYDLVARVAATGDHETVEWHVETAAGERRLLEAKLTPATIAGEDRVLALSRDVTERQRRERAIRALQDATERMQDAETAEAVAETAVEAAREALDLPVTMCWFHDSGAGRLDPVVATDEVHQRDLWSGLSADRYEYDVFREGEVTTYAPREHAAENPLETAVLLPLGDHGLLAAGRADEADYDEVTLDVARTLAEHTTTALDRVERATQVRESERRFRLIAERVDQVIFLATPDFSDVYYVNDAYEKVWGHPVEELMEEPRGFIEYIDPRDREAFEADFEAMIAEIEAGEADERYEFEYRVRRPDGDVRWVRATGYPAGFESGERRFVGIVEDVTERRELERTYRSVFENVSDGLVVHDPDTGEILDVNDRFCEMNGYERDEFVGETVDVITAPDHELEHAADRIQRARSEGAQLFEWRNKRADGETFPVEVHLSVVDIRGEERVLASVRDITERKQREREYEQIFNGVQDAINIMDPERLEILDANDAYLEMFGYDDVETVRELGVEGLSLTEEGFTRERSQEIHQRVAERGEPETVEWQIRTREGDRRWLETKVAPAVINGEDVNTVIHRDVTERRRREREYEQIFDGVTDAISVHDPETGEMLDVNRTYVEAFDYEDKSAILDEGVEGLSVTEEGYTAERSREVVREVAETGEPVTVEWLVETADGERRWFEVNTTPAEIGGEPRVLGISRDVTERKRRERIIRALHDTTGEFQEADTREEVCEAAVAAAETVLDLSMTACWLPAGGAESDLEPAAATEATWEIPGGPGVFEPGGFEYEVYDSGDLTVYDPRERWDRTPFERAFLVPLGEHGLLGAAEPGVEEYDDLTLDAAQILAGHATAALDRVERERERRRSERRLEAILDRIDEAIFLTRAREITQSSQDPDYISSGYEAIWGQPLAGIRDRYEDGFFGTLYPDDEGAYRAFVERVVSEIEAGEAGDSYSTEYRIERPDGEVRWVQSDYYPIEWADGPARIVIVSRDVTDRKERERRIASFESATDDLATADDPGEAATLAVRAGTDDLGLRAVGVFLYDDDEGVLRPDVVADPMRDAVGDRTVGPGEGPLWNAFASGAVVDPEGTDATDPVPGAEGLADWRAIALGNHGVLLVGSPDSALDGDTVQAAHVLGATLEAALNHLRGQQRLAVQEEQLRTQTERAERLDRIVTLAQQVEAAINEASDPAEVERAVPERLAGTGPYEAAWIGGVEVGTDRIEPRAVVGAAREYVAGLDLVTSDAGADRHPAVRAWTENEPAVADSLVDGGPAGDWRRRALAEGHQSLCAVPLTYDGVTHGVLTVAADSPNAFGDREQSVLAGLGTSVGYALAAIERRRALESDETVELEFAGPGTDLRFARAAREAGCTVRHERTVPREGGDVSVYFTLEGDVPEDATDVAERVLPGGVDVVSEESGSVLVETVTDDWFGSPLAEYGAVLREASATPDETTVVVELPAGADVRSFSDRLAELAPSLSLVAKRQHQQRDRTAQELRSQVEAELTDRQYEVLTTALSAGYFEWPRESDGGEVAERLGITQPTLNKHLRLGERKTFELLFGDA